MAGDYKSAGNIQNVYGQSGGAFDAGAAGTAPAFFLPGQIIKVPTSSTAGGGAATNYHLVKITAVGGEETKDSKTCVKVSGEIVKDGGDNELTSFLGNNFEPGDGDETTYSESIASALEYKRT